MRKRTDIIIIIASVAFITFLSIGEATGCVSIDFKSAWFYIAIIVVILAVVQACMDLKGKFKSRNTELAKRFYMQGLEFKMRGELNPAISNFKMALIVAPDFTLAHQALGEALLLKGKHKKAAKHFMKAHDLDFKESEPEALGTESSESLVAGLTTSKKYGFSIICPEGWKVIGGKESKLAGGDFVVEFRGPNAHIHIIVGRTNDVSIEDTERNALRNLHLVRGKLESFKRIELDGTKAVEAIYATQYDTKIKKIGLVSNHIEFVITCGTTNKKAEFKQCEPIFDECLQSLRFKKAESK